MPLLPNTYRQESLYPYSYSLLSHLGTPSLLGDTIALQVPCVVHHELEVVVAVDGHGDVVVVFDPLVCGDTTVSLIFNMVRVVKLESVKEVEKNLILGLLSRNDIGVLGSIVDSLDVSDVDGT